MDGSIVRFDGATMGPTYSVKIADMPSHLAPNRLAFEIEAVLEDMNQSLSTYLPDSEIMRFNRFPTTDWVSVSTPLFDVLQQASYWGHKTAGAFDVTVGPLVNLWGFGPQWSSRQIPEARLILQAAERVGHGLLEIRSRPPAIRKSRPDVFLDLSGIAKGYVVDRIVELLVDKGINRCLVEIGGELRALGHNERGLSWTVAIERPLPVEGLPQPVIRLSGVAVATSGDYRSFFTHDGRRYSHLIDPRSGWPLEQELASVTVVASSAAAADALATGLMIVGAAEAEQFALREGTAAFFLIREGEGFREVVTPSLERRLGYLE